MNGYTVGIYTLGCKVSQYESEAIAEQFEAAGFTRLPFDSECDVYIINTCTVTAESDRKSRQVIRRAANGNSRAVVMVTGCYSQVSPDEVRQIPGVSYVGGSYNKNELVEKAQALLALEHPPAHPEIAVSDLDKAPFEPMTIKSSPRTRAYVKIEDGCESRCAYCIIPTARGKIRSKSEDDVVSEVAYLAAEGCREVVLTGIETASYGRDIGTDLITLLERIDREISSVRIRLGSLDPSIMTEEFIGRIARLPSLAPHFHLSTQSGSDRVLAAMRRKYNTGMMKESVRRLREAIPDVTFTTDMLVGFPGETDDEFEETCDFARQIGFLNMHIFPYSRREGTEAAEMPHQIPDEIKRERASALAKVRDEIKTALLQSYIDGGQPLEALFEKCADGFMSGHTANFIEVRAPSLVNLHGQTKSVKLLAENNGFCIAAIL